MEVLFLTIFVSLVLVACGVLFFAWMVRQRTFDQNDRLALLPLLDEPPPAAGAATGPTREDDLGDD